MVFNFFPFPLPAVLRGPVGTVEAAGEKGTETKGQLGSQCWVLSAGVRPWSPQGLPPPGYSPTCSSLSRLLHSSHCPGQVQSSGAFQLDPEAIFEHFLCLANLPEHRVWNTRSCGFCMHQSSEGCELYYIFHTYWISEAKAQVVYEYLF